MCGALLLRSALVSCLLGSSAKPKLSLEERERWLNMLIWADPAYRAKPLRGGRPGECQMAEDKYRAMSEHIRRELY